MLYYDGMKTTKIPGYSVLPNGRIYSDKSEMFMKHFVMPNGYCTVQLRNGKNREPHYVHRLVAETYIPNPDNKETVNHKDGNKQNNDVSNLEWMTRSENSTHKVQTLRKGAGTQKGGSKLTPDLVQQIRDDYKAGIGSMKKLGDKYGVCAQTICNAVNAEHSIYGDLA